MAPIPMAISMPRVLITDVLTKSQLHRFFFTDSITRSCVTGFRATMKNPSMGAIPYSMMTEFVKYIHRLQRRTTKNEMRSICLLTWNLSITFPQKIEPTANAPFCIAEIIATSPIPPPRNITYNGITVLKPCAVTLAGSANQIHPFD